MGETMGPVTAIVLTGGRSSRMGAPKEFVTLCDGRAMVQHVIAALRPIASEIFLSVGTKPTEEQSNLGLPFLMDREPFEGPLFAIGNVMRELSGRDLLIACCDQPLLRAPILSQLVAGTRESLPAFFVTSNGADIVPFPSFFPASSHATLLAAIDSGERSLRRWAGAHPCRLVALEEKEAESLQSFNSMAELIRAGLVAAPPGV